MKGKRKEQSYAKKDYDHYHFSLKESVKYLVTGSLALCMAVDYLFYRNVWLLATYGTSSESVLSEMAAEPIDPGETEKAELSV